MSPLGSPRRRQWWIIVTAALLLLVAGTLAWQFRPLNVAERALVGRWREPVSGIVLELLPNRDFFVVYAHNGVREQVGHWRALDSRVSLRPMLRFQNLVSSLDQVARYFLNVPFVSPYDVQWDGPDRITIGGGLFIRAAEDPQGTPGLRTARAVGQR